MRLGPSQPPGWITDGIRLIRKPARRNERGDLDSGSKRGILDARTGQFPPRASPSFRFLSYGAPPTIAGDLPGIPEGDRRDIMDNGSSEYSLRSGPGSIDGPASRAGAC